MDMPVDDVAPRTIVMGPDSSSSAAELSNGNALPIFLTGSTMKKKYVDELRMWIEMMESYSKSEKMKFEFANARVKIYRRCDEKARNILDEARANGELILKGDDDKDPLRTKLVEKVISLIATESIPERTNRKVAILNDIRSCVRTEGETPTHFGMRFKILTANYAVQVGHLDQNKSCRLALAMLQNARLPPTVQSNIVIQLSGKIKSEKNRLKSYVMDKSKFDSLLVYVEDLNNEPGTVDHVFEHEIIEQLKKMSEGDIEEDGFTLRNTTEVMEQIKENTDLCRSSSMLGERERDEPRSTVRLWTTRTNGKGQPLVLSQDEKEHRRIPQAKASRKQQE